MKKKITIILFLLAVVLLGVPAAEGQAAAVYAAVSPALSKTTIGMNIYDGTESTSVIINNLPENTAVTWECSSSNLAVERSFWDESEFILTPKKKGEYTVKFHVGSTTLSCKVTVINKNVTFVRSSKSLNDEITKKFVEGMTTLCLYSGEKETLKLKNVSDSSDAVWESSDTSIATVNKNGVVTAKNYGYATITAAYMGKTYSYLMEVTYKDAALALRYAAKHYHSTYSQPKRMSTGYYDCSSYVWRSYASVKHYLGGSSNYAPTAAELAKWCVQKGFAIMEDMDPSNLLPGDIIFETGNNNGRYRGIYHVDFCSGYGVRMTVARTKYYLDSNVIVARPCLGAPSAPKGKTDVFSNYVSWSDSRSFGAGKYQIYRSTSVKGTYSLVKTVKNQTYYYDENVSDGKTYYYKIKPVWTAGKTYKGKLSTNSSAVKKKKGTTQKPVLSNTVDGVQIQWGKIPGATEYRIYRLDNSKWKCIAVAGKSKTSAVDKEAVTSKTYKYRLQAYKDKTASKISKTVSIKFYETPVLETVANTTDGVQISWKAVSGISRYLVYRREGNDDWTEYTVVSGNSFLDSKVSDGTTYRYSVQCLNGSRKAVSGYQTSVSGHMYLEAPRLESVYSTDYGIELNWSESFGESDYRVFRKVLGATEWMAVGDTSYTYYYDENVEDGVTYLYTVCCISTDGSKVLSAYRENSDGVTYHKPVDDYNGNDQGSEDVDDGSSTDESGTTDGSDSTDESGITDGSDSTDDNSDIDETEE